MQYNNKFFKIPVVFIMFLFVLLSCKEKGVQVSGDDVQPGVYSSPEFLEFYEKFGTDSIFQIEHIVFPLEGEPSRKDILEQIPPDFKWQREDWVIHRKFNDMGGTFERELIDISGIVIENIHDTSGKYTMERRFGKLSSGWHLIYYKELGPNY
jgi:hypothetical protein